MSDKISGVSIKIDGLTYTYEAHTMTKVVEILASQLKTIRAGKDQYGFPKYLYEIENFTVNYFK